MEQYINYQENKKDKRGNAVLWYTYKGSGSLSGQMLLVK